MSFLEILYLCIQIVCSVVAGVFLGLILGAIAYGACLVIGLIFSLFVFVIKLAFGKES